MKVMWRSVIPTAPAAVFRPMQAPTDVAFAACGSRPLRASDQLLTVSRGFVREQSRLDCLELALGERALRPQPRDFLELRVPPLKGRRLDHGFLAPRPPVDELRKPAGLVTGVGIKGLHMRPFVAFDRHIQLTAVGEVIFRASRHQTHRPDRQEASGLQFTTDFGLRACTPCRLPSHQPRKGASRMLRSLMAKR